MEECGFASGAGLETAANVANAGRSSPIVVTVNVTCHAGGRGFESRRSRKKTCKSACCVVGSGGTLQPTTQTLVRDGPKRAKTTRKRDCSSRFSTCRDRPGRRRAATQNGRRSRPASRRSGKPDSRYWLLGRRLGIACPDRCSNKAPTRAERRRSGRGPLLGSLRSVRPNALEPFEGDPIVPQTARQTGLSGAISLATKVVEPVVLSSASPMSLRCVRLLVGVSTSPLLGRRCAA